MNRTSQEWNRFYDLVAVLFIYLLLFPNNIIIFISLYLNNKTYCILIKVVKKNSHLIRSNEFRVWFLALKFTFSYCDFDKRISNLKSITILWHHLILFILILIILWSTSGVLQVTYLRHYFPLVLCLDWWR